MKQDLLTSIQNTAQGVNFEDLLCFFSIEVPEHITKKNKWTVFRNRRTGKVGIGAPRDLKLAENYLVYEMQEQALKQGWKEPYTGPVWAIFHFYFTNEQYYAKPKRKADKPVMKKNVKDLSNLIQLPEDVLQKAGIIENDCQICSLDLSRRLVGEKTKVEIFLLKYRDTLWNNTLQT